MTGPGRRFDPAELRSDSGGDPSDAEMADALAAARELEMLSARDQVGPTVGFEDRVMAAIAAEAPPRLVVRATRPGLGGRFAALAGSVGAAWRVATSGGRPVFVRAQALAFVLLIVLASGSLAGVAAIGAVNLLTPPARPAPTIRPAVTSPSPSAPTPAAPTPSRSPEVSPEAQPSDGPGSTDEPGATDSPGATDDHGGDGAEPTETDGSRTARPTATPRRNATPRPTKTPEAEDTPEPNETPEPDETDDHSGSGGSGSGSGGGNSGGD